MVDRPAQAAWLLILAAATVGIGASGMLLAGHDGGWRLNGADGGVLAPWCGAGRVPSRSCADTVASQWGAFDFTLGSRTFLVPTSYLGLAYFVGVGLWFVMLGRIPASARLLWRCTLIATVAGSVVSLIFLGLMVFSLRTWCSLCVTAHGANAVVAAAGFLLWRKVRLADPNGRETGRIDLWSAGLGRRQTTLALATILAACGGLYLYYESVREARRHWREASAFRHAIASVQRDGPFLVREYLAQPYVDVPRTLDLRRERSSAPRHHLVVFSDFDSHPCACFESRWRKEFQPGFGSDIDVEFRFTPNVLLRDGTEAPVPQEHLLAAAAERHLDPAAYVRLRSSIFKRALARESSQRPPDLAALAPAGVAVDVLMSDVNLAAAQTTVASDVALARGLGVTTTPALFLDGRRVPELCVNSDVFWTTIRQTLDQPSRLAAATEHAILRTGTRNIREAADE
jgi:uncharacterized membrane protein